MVSPNLQKLWKRARSWYLARVLGVYVLASSAVLQGIDLLESQFGLPAWFFPAALALLLIGFPIVTLTAVLQRRKLEELIHGEVSGADALSDGAEVDGLGRWFTWRKAILGGTLAFLALASVGLTVAWLRNRGTALSADAVAVMPFHVVGSDADLWREGLVDLMGTALDATGQFHSADPRAVLNRWHRAASDPQELPEPTKAAEVAGSLGAGRVILGSLIRTGPNQVRLAADLYSVRWLRREAKAAVEGPEDEMTTLVDRLTLDLLREIWRGDSIPELRVSAMTTTSIPALRAYLEGEQAYRRSQFEDAQAAYTEAIDHDSAFAIAHYRLAQTYGWFRGLGAEEVPKHLAAAERHSKGLSRRDSLLIRGWKLADVDGDVHAIELFENLVNRYADDLEAWHGLGDALFHMGGQLNRPLSAAIAPLQRTLALDSTFAPALIHLIEIAYLQNDPKRAREWTDCYLALDTSSMYSRSFGLLTPLQFGPASDSAQAVAALDTADAELLHWMIARLRGSGYNLPVYEQVAIALTDPRFDTDDRAMGLWHLGEAHLRFGHVDLAIDLFQQAMATAKGGFEEAVLYALATARELGIATDSLSKRLVDRLAANIEQPIPALAVEAARDGRKREALAAVEWLEERSDSLTAQGYLEMGRSVRGQALALKGRIAATSDSADAAISYLRSGLSTINATWSRSRDIDRYWLASLIEDRGGEEEALGIYGSLYANPWLEPLGLFHRAELHERRGEYEEAARYYARFLELWGTADPHLQPRVESARLALERIRGERFTS